MTSSIHRLSIALATIATFIAIGRTHDAVAATDDIGTATAITTVVTGKLDTGALTLKSGDTVFQNETITTDDKGVGSSSSAIRPSWRSAPARPSCSIISYTIQILPKGR